MSSRKSRRPFRFNPFARPSRKPAAQLASAAGERPEMLEHLEQRQMLFTLTVPGIPGQDFGTVTAFFSYGMPYLAPTVAEGTAAAQAVLEDFNTDNPGAPVANIPADFIFDQSNLQLHYTAGQLSVAQLVGTNNQNSVRIVMQQGESFSFRVPIGFGGLRQFSSPGAMSMDIGGTFDTNFMTVELRLNGARVNSFTGAALLALSVPLTPGVNTYSFAAPPGLSFDDIIFNATGGPEGPFTVDNVRFNVPAGRFVPMVTARITGAAIVFSAPAGATIQVFDLYGRDMRNTLLTPSPPQVQPPITLIDPNDDGILDFNDGIGRIVMTGTDRDSALTMWGGTIVTFTGPPPVEAERVEGPFAFLLVPSVVGQYDTLEAGGFGYSATPAGPGTWRVSGLPPGPGSLVIGSPFVRPLANYNPGGLALGGGNFNRADQGIFVTGGASIASVYIHGILHGASVLTGFVDRFIVGYMVGSAAVSGDLGYFTSGSDAGLWVDDDGTPFVNTGGTLTVGRTLGEFAVAGRSLMNVTVIGDINSPITRPARDVLRYSEHEWPAGVLNPNTELTLVRVFLNNNDYRQQNRLISGLGIFFTRIDQGLVFGTGTVRNDTLLSAEWVGSIATSVQINGDLGFTDVVNGTADPSDVYAFAADGTQDVVIQLDGTLVGGIIGAYMRIVDQDGRTLAAPQAATRQSEFVGMRFRPNKPGVYYLVVQSPNSVAGTYVLNMSGMAPTALGSYRSGASTGRGGQGQTVQVLSGGMGSFRVGTGFVDGGGAEVSPAVTINVVPQQVDVFDDTPDEYMALRAMTLSVTGNLYNLTTGSDIQDNQGGGVFTMIVSGNLGTLVTGLSPIVGTGFAQGDLRFANFSIGGSIGMLDIRGALGYDQDGQQAFPVDFANSVVIRTGTRISVDPSLRGDIGMIRVGSNAGGGTFSVQTPPNTTVGGFVVNQDGGTNGISFPLGQQSPTGENFSLGFNSDLRFFDTPRIDLNGFVNFSYALPQNVPLELVDDAGGRVTLQVVGGTAGAGGLVRAMPIGGSLGVAIGRVEVNLTGGAQLLITTQGNLGSTDIISIGRIVVTNSDANSSISINGNTQLDVWQIVQTGGTLFGGISNVTPFGDIVAIDMVALTNLFVGTGDIGRTQVPAWGPQLIGPAIGVLGAAGGGTGGVGTPILVPANVVSQYFNGNGFRPVNDSRVGIPTPLSYIDDVGSPVDPFLDGVIVRTGNITTVQAGGAVGDVIANDLQNAGSGIIVSVVANADSVTPLGRFDGIVGTVYANRIASLDIGDGIAQRATGPMSTTGVFANDDIGTIFGTRIVGAFISSVIDAANNVVGNTDGVFPTDGINAINLTGGGSFVDAYVGAMNLDNFWSSFFSFDDGVFNGDINQFTGTSANFLRSRLEARALVNFSLTGGFYDASETRIRNNVGRMEAVGYRNSTISGGDQEFVPNTITVGGDITVLTTFNRAGDIDDLTVDVNGRIFEVSSNNMSRDRIDADLEIRLILTVSDIRASEITTGMFTQGTIGKNIRSSEIRVSGPLASLIVADAITNTSIEVSGPDGRLDLLRVRQTYTGSIAVAGPTTLIEVTEGDLIARILTVVNLRGVPGNIETITTGRDMDLDADIGGTITTLNVGRHLGNRDIPRPIVVHGDVSQINVPHGQLYSDFYIDQRLTGSMTIGAVNNRPGSNLLGSGSLIAFGRLENVFIEGDFGGRIISYSGGINSVVINNGSLLESGNIQAFDGDINQVVINSGHLLGDIHADYILYLVQVNASADGVFGDIGINPTLSQGNPYNTLRNQLPPGVVPDNTIQGPRITAGFNVGRVIVNNGSIFEAFIQAGRAIGTIDVTGDIRNDTLTTGTGTVIAAGSSIFTVHATGNIADTIVIAGVRSFGNDGRPGGTGANADTIQSGRIETVHSDANGTNVLVTAGMNAGPDGIYNTGDESVVLGVSFVRNVLFGGSVTNSSVFADSPTLNASPGVIKAGFNFVLADPDLSDGSPVVGGQITPGVPFLFTLPGGINGTILFTGPGQAYYDNVAHKVILVSTSLLSTLDVQASGTLTDFDIVTNDDASMGSINVGAPLAGDSDIVVDAYCLSITVGNFSGTGSIKAGMNIRSITTGVFSGGFISAAFYAGSIVINGGFGITTTTGEARIDATAAGSIVINGTFAGLVNIERDLGGITVNGAVSFAQFRAGGSVGAFVSGPMNQTRVSVGDYLGPVTIVGDATESVIQAGGDLGADAAPGGTGFNADRVSTGNIASVNISGNFARSSIVAGMLRGPDIYFGTADDAAAAGRSNIGPVVITGNQVGSNLGSESFRVSATGVVAGVSLAGQVVTQVGNFRVESLATRSNPLRVQDLIVSEAAQVWLATIFFNQSIDASTVGTSLTISEVRDGGATLITLVQGVDYTIIPSAFKDRVIIQFSRTVTDRDLVAPGGTPAPGIPGPGVFRFFLSSATLRGTVADARLDSDLSTRATEDYSQDTIVGDAGDKLVSEIIDLNGRPIDMYGPADLTVVLDGNLSPDGLPDPNMPFIVRGFIGDHPDHGIADFRVAADTDIYQITLRAGQVLRMGAMQGAAIFTGRSLYNAAGVIQFGATADTYQLPSDPEATLDLTLPDDYLIKTTGTYYIVVGNFGLLGPGSVPDAVPGVSDTGDYNFGLQVFDDFDTGFNAATFSGNGTPVVNAPAATVFYGPNLTPQNPGDPGYDDVTEVAIGDYIFTMTNGADGNYATPGDNVVTGANRSGITSTRTGSSLFSSIESAIGPRGHRGVPGDISSDVDVFVLNNGQTIDPGRTITVKIKLAEIGADLGSFGRVTGTDFRGNVQFAIFDVTGATSADDGVLLASPTDFKSIAQPTKVISQQGPITYGYDANGDFYITFVTTGRIGGLATDPAKYAVYLQGVFNTDYTIEVSQNEAAPVTAIPQNRQNVFIETRGGSIDWLQVGGQTTTLAPFSAAVLGITGAAANGQNAGDYILSSLVAKLNSVFTANGLNVVFSTDPGAFEFQPFSTVFLSATTDPTTIFNTDNFGYSQHSDPFNSDLNDEAAIFLPSFAQLGYTPAQADMDNLVLSLTGAVGRRVGELMGLRIEANDSVFTDPVNIMAANSVFRTPPFQSTDYGFGTLPRALSTVTDSVINTNFFLGQQNAFALLDKFLTP